MPRNMSFAITTRQFRDRTKLVTRRVGWNFLLPGDVVCAVEKAMGLKKGEKIVPLGLIEIVSNFPEPLNIITQEEVVLEGFPDLSPDEFVAMFCRHMKVTHDFVVNRIAYKYLDSQ
jgi:hypothetical protein